VDFVLVARENFFAGEKSALRWRGPRRITKAISDYVYQVEDLRDGNLEEATVSRLLFYSDPLLDTDAIMPHVLSSETGMHVQRLMRLADDGSRGVLVVVHCRRLPHSEDTIAYNVSQMLLNLFNRKSTAQQLMIRANPNLAFERE